jgi:hypothetical protein
MNPVIRKEILIGADLSPKAWKEWIVVEVHQKNSNFISIHSEYQENDQRPRYVYEISNDFFLIPKKNIKALIQALTQIQNQLDMESI